MRRAICWTAAAALGLGLAQAQPATADVIKLRTSCTGESGLCLTSLADVLAEVHEPTSPRDVPGPTNRVVVDIGPGVFDLESTDYPYCVELSNLAFKGSGKLSTTLTGGGFEPANLSAILGPYAVYIENCADVEFQDLTIRNEPGTSRGGVAFDGDGNTHWSNVRIQTDSTHSAGWYDHGASSPEASIHYWFSAEIEVRQSGASSTALWAQGSSHRIYGSKLVVTLVTGNAGNTYGTLGLAGPFDVRVHGSRIAAINSVANKETFAIRTVGAAALFYGSCEGGALSVQGSEIEAISPASGGLSYAIGDFCELGSTRHLDVRGSYFRVEGGTAKRLIAYSGESSIASPYAIGAGANPPAVSTAWSVKGMDTFLETDCSATVCNGTPQAAAETHELSFDPACTGTGANHGPWFDTKLGKCRGT